MGGRAGDVAVDMAGHGGIGEGRVGDGGALAPMAMVALAVPLVSVKPAPVLPTFSMLPPPPELNSTSPSMMPLLLITVSPVVPASRLMAWLLLTTKAPACGVWMVVTARMEPALLMILTLPD